MSKRIPWRHVAALPPIQRNRVSEIRARIVESEQGFGVQLWIALHDQPELEPAPHAPALVLYGDSLPQAVAVLSGASETILKLKRARR